MRITTVTVRRPNGKRWRSTSKVWFANGIHHHYSNDKFVPEFRRSIAVAESIPVEKFGDELNALRAVVCEAIFNPELYKTQLNQAEGQDLVTTSANNYYEGVTGRSGRVLP